MKTQKKKCKNCGTEFDPKEVARIYGKESSVVLFNMCSSQCYTKHIMPKTESNAS